MKITLIIETNNHPCNEYVIKNYWNVPDVANFGQKIKKNLT